MEAYATALLYAIPSFTLLVIIETLFIVFIKKLDINHLDIISSLSSGITNVIKDSLGVLLIILSYPWLVSKIAVINIESISYSWIIFIAFITYG